MCRHNQYFANIVTRVAPLRMLCSPMFLDTTSRDQSLYLLFNKFLILQSETINETSFIVSEYILGKGIEGKINIKKDLLVKVGNAKQCKLCDKIFSSEFKAVDHIHQTHNDIESIKSKIAEKSFTKKIENKKNQYKCKFCGLAFLTKEATVPHLKEIHGINTLAARKRSIQHI